MRHIISEISYGPYDMGHIMSHQHNMTTKTVYSDGSVWSWGRATRGQLGRSPDPQDSPRQITITGNAFTVDTNDGISLLTARKTS